MTINDRSGLRQLFQAYAPNTNAYSVFRKVAKRKVVLTCLNVVNSTNAAVTWSFFLDRDGTTYSAATALAYNQSLAANTSVQVTWGELGLPLDYGVAGNFAVQAGAANAITYTGLGVEL